MFGASFLIGLALAIAAYVMVYYRALKYRRKMWVHSGYMLTTPLILFELPFSRILNGFMPGLAIRGPADFRLIMPSILWSIALELLVIAAIWLKYREQATPFLVAGGFIVAQMLAMGLMADSALLKSLLTTLGELPSAAVVLSGFAIGALTSWAGWTGGQAPDAGRRRRRSRPEWQRSRNGEGRKAESDDGRGCGRASQFLSLWLSEKIPASWAGKDREGR